MDLENLLAHVYSAGGGFIAEGGAVKYRGPKETLTPEVRQTINEHKAQMLADLEWAAMLPDEIYIPASVPNDEETIAICIEGQCLTVVPTEVRGAA